MAGTGTTFASDEDPELIGEALPFALKLIESVLAESPNHPGLLLAATSDFTQYSRNTKWEEWPCECSAPLEF